MSALSTTMYQNSLLISLWPRAAFTRTTVILDREDPARRFPGRQVCGKWKSWPVLGKSHSSSQESHWWGWGPAEVLLSPGPPAATPPWLHLSV